MARRLRLMKLMPVVHNTAVCLYQVNILMKKNTSFTDMPESSHLNGRFMAGAVPPMTCPVHKRNIILCRSSP